MFIELSDIMRARSCPVCYHGSLPSKYRQNYPTFTAMMRHWEKAHPKALPGQGGIFPVSNARKFALGLNQQLEIDSIVPQEDVDRWADDQEAHVPEVRATWDALGYVEGGGERDHATQEREVEEGSVGEHQDGDGARQAAEASGRHSHEEGGQGEEGQEAGRKVDEGRSDTHT